METSRNYRGVYEASGVTELQLIKEIRAPLPYNLLSQLESYMVREGYEIAARDFGERVVLALNVPSDREADFIIATATAWTS
jgi:hypothetical protein